MSFKYRYDHRSVKQRRRRIVGVIIILMFIIGALVGLLVWDIKKNENSSATGSSSIVSQVINEDVQHLIIDEPYFRLELPSDWKEAGRKNTDEEKSITWRSTKKGGDARQLTLYTDTIPKDKAVNRLVPVSAQGNILSVGDVSDNCATFTGGGTLNAEAASKLKPTPAKWQKVDFICDLPLLVENEVGTGSTDGINTVKVTGPAKGTHQYFFLYTDHNIPQNDSIFLEALRSFKAK